MGFANERIFGAPLRLIASGGRQWSLLIADGDFAVKRFQTSDHAMAGMVRGRHADGGHMGKSR